MMSGHKRRRAPSIATDCKTCSSSSRSAHHGTGVPLDLAAGSGSLRRIRMARMSRKSPRSNAEKMGAFVYAGCSWPLIAERLSIDPGSTPKSAALSSTDFRRHCADGSPYARAVFSKETLPTIARSVSTRCPRWTSTSWIATRHQEAWGGRALASRTCGRERRVCSRWRTGSAGRLWKRNERSAFMRPERSESRTVSCWLSTKPCAPVNIHCGIARFAFQFSRRDLAPQSDAEPGTIGGETAAPHPPSLKRKNPSRSMRCAFASASAMSTATFAAASTSQRFDDADRGTTSPLTAIATESPNNRDQIVHVRRASCAFSFRKDETIWTENSQKFNRDEIVEMAQRSGFRCETQWIDLEWPFSQNLLIAV